MKVLLTICKGVLQDLEFSITRDKLRFLLGQNKKLSSFNKKAVLVKDMLDDLLEQDDMLCDMYLTDKKAGKLEFKMIILKLKCFWKHIITMWMK